MSSECKQSMSIRYWNCRPFWPWSSHSCSDTCRQICELFCTTSEVIASAQLFSRNSLKFLRCCRMMPLKWLFCWKILLISLNIKSSYILITLDSSVFLLLNFAFILMQSLRIRLKMIKICFSLDFVSMDAMIYWTKTTNIWYEHTKWIIFF